MNWEYVACLIFCSHVLIGQNVVKDLTRLVCGWSAADGFVPARLDERFQSLQHRVIQLLKLQVAHRRHALDTAQHGAKWRLSVLSNSAQNFCT